MPRSLAHRTCLAGILLASGLGSAAGWAQVAPAPGGDASPRERDSGTAATAAPLPAGQTAREQARALYQQGELAYKEGRYLEAARHFRQAARYEPNPVLSYNIALAYDAVGEVAEALRWYRDYLRRVPDAPDRDEVKANARRLENRAPEVGCAAGDDHVDARRSHGATRR